jgi:hypothetical protein
MKLPVTNLMHSQELFSYRFVAVGTNDMNGGVSMMKCQFVVRCWYVICSRCMILINGEMFMKFDKVVIFLISNFVSVTNSVL